MTEIILNEIKRGHRVIFKDYGASKEIDGVWHLSSPGYEFCDEVIGIVTFVNLKQNLAQVKRDDPRFCYDGWHAYIDPARILKVLEEGVEIPVVKPETLKPKGQMELF